MTEPVKTRLKGTAEQMAICASTADILKIRAGAGTGKTTTLRALAARHRDVCILYLAFNKSVKEEAQGKFVPNVKAMTAHGLAFARVGKDYANVPNKLASGDLKPFHVLPMLSSSLKGLPKTAHNLYGGRVIETLKAFLVSSDPDPASIHVTMGTSPVEKRYFHSETILAAAASLWERMRDLRSLMPITHDGYLKLFQLSRPVLPYGMILLDEAQDTNAVTQAIIEDQDARRVYVGDEHQAIYAFRGARNAMAIIDAQEEYSLTGSFRFGPEVADVANAILASKGEAVRLQGLGGPSRVGPLDGGAPHAFISRGNSALFGRAVQALDKKESFAFVGPLYNYRLDLIEQTYLLSTRRPVRDPFLNAFTGYAQLEEYADAMGDREIKGRCNLVNKYTNRIPCLIASIQEKAQTHPGGGAVQVILTSGHRSKGLEFDRVRLADDFMDFFEEDSGLPKDLVGAPAHVQEEVNLQYVAATRAKRQLEVGDKLRQLLEHRAVVARRGAV